MLLGFKSLWEKERWKFVYSIQEKLEAQKNSAPSERMCVVLKEILNNPFMQVHSLNVVSAIPEITYYKNKRTCESHVSCVQR